MTNDEIKRNIDVLIANMYVHKEGSKELAAEAGLRLLENFLININNLAYFADEAHARATRE